jgi:hypothetical protein
MTSEGATSSGPPGTYSGARPFNSRCLRTQTGRLIDARALSWLGIILATITSADTSQAEYAAGRCRLGPSATSADGASFWFSGNGDIGSKVLWKDAERLVCRRWRPCANGDPVAEHPTPGSLNCLPHEYEVKDDLDDAWAARLLGLVRERGQTILVLKDPGGEPLDRPIGPRMEIRTFLSLRSPYPPPLGGYVKVVSLTTTSSRPTSSSIP